MDGILRTVKLIQGKLALVDDDDYEELQRFSWRIRKSANGVLHAQRHDRSSGRDLCVFMHRQILGVTDSQTKVDHKDHDGLNNQKYNLRVATTQQNGANMRARPGFSSRFKGVSWDGTRDLWLARVKYVLRD